MGSDAHPAFLHCVRAFWGWALEFGREKGGRLSIRCT